MFTSRRYGNVMQSSSALGNSLEDPRISSAKCGASELWYYQLLFSIRSLQNNDDLRGFVIGQRYEGPVLRAQGCGPGHHGQVALDKQGQDASSADKRELPQS